MRRKWRFVSLFVVAISLIFFIGTVQQAASYFLYPFLLVQNKVIVPIKIFFKKRKTVQELSQEVEDLNAQCVRLQARLIELQATADYSQQINELVQFKRQYQQGNGIIAQVLVKQFSEQANFFLVDAGTRAGVQVNMPVVYNNCLVGRVQEVYPLYCKVVLITDKTCKVAAYCEKTMAEGIYEGTNNQETALLSHVSHLYPIQQHDMVFSSGQGLIFPRGFGLGSIDEFYCDNLTYRISIKPLINVRDIQYVLLLDTKT